jgi:hypothetical protein
MKFPLGDLGRFGVLFCIWHLAFDILHSAFRVALFSTLLGAKPRREIVEV